MCRCIAVRESRKGGWTIALATWGGCGLAPKAPGTAGSIVALALGYIAVEVFRFPPLTLGLAAAVLFWPACRAAEAAEKHFGREDPPQVVVDEVIGQWLTLSMVEAGSHLSWLAALILFRVFDIAKPFPIRRFEKLPGGLGVVADDLAAGACAMITLWGLGWFGAW